MIIIGESLLNLKSGKYIFEEIKNFLINNDKIDENWNSLNLISKNASSVGSYDLNLFSDDEGKNKVLKKIEGVSLLKIQVQRLKVLKES